MVPEGRRANPEKGKSFLGEGSSGADKLQGRGIVKAQKKKPF